MAAFLAARLFQAMIALWGVATLVFFLARMTGDPVLLLAPENATEADLQQLRVSLGFDRPLPVQYADFLAGLVQGDLGRSVAQGVPVADIIAARLPYTLWLAGGALVVALGLGLPAGIYMGVRRQSRGAKALMALVYAGQSLPTFWSGILLILVFGITLGWLPTSGARSVSSMILPSVALGLLSMATFARIARTSILDEMPKLYVRAARARGLGARATVVRHVLRNGAIPVISVAALEIANLLAGAVIVETVFAWPGLGLLTVQSINARDFPVVQGVVLLGAAAAILLNLVADLLYSAVDPRIRLGGRAT
ncbi:ABC transporter permease [Roseivivax isoporae]|uniref:Glutathione ABC transporter permease n=1 Tax=Roseivivax isoporae LMG 25204 TaxID=1449351 RepID=X7FCW1_9RHOB|nr:ABC transporter permease [Roseivivax isoporae]ETX29894.1 glutathione ABC transporter permease [Roseivivax isoporae LMG 25204]